VTSTKSESSRCSPCFHLLTFKFDPRVNRPRTRLRPLFYKLNVNHPPFHLSSPTNTTTPQHQTSKPSQPTKMAAIPPAVAERARSTSSSRRVPLSHGRGGAGKITFLSLLLFLHIPETTNSPHLPFPSSVFLLTSPSQIIPSSRPSLTTPSRQHRRLHLGR
jgi:hypothetical protein